MRVLLDKASCMLVMHMDLVGDIEIPNVHAHLLF